MKTSFLFGFLTLIVVLIICLVMKDWVYIYRFSGTIGAVSLAACGISIGAFQSGGEASFGGDAVSDYRSETIESKESRVKWSTRFFFYGLPNIIAAGIYIYNVFIKV